MGEHDPQYEEGKRAGAHPLVVVFSIIGGLWLLLLFYVPSQKDKPATVPANPESAHRVADDDAETSPVMFKVQATMADVNAVSVVVPPQATDSQIAGLLKRFKQARLANTLLTHIPPTTPGHKLGAHAVAEIYIFSVPEYATADAVRVLARGAHTPGKLYPQAIPFEEAMEQVRGFYRIDLSDTSHPDKASVGFADESGVHSKNYRELF